MAHAEHHRYFFDRLENPNWLLPLSEHGFFKNPPGAVRDPERQTITYPLWPESRYLVRMAALDPKAVFLVLCDMPDSDNLLVRCDILDAAIAAPPEIAAQIIPKIQPWLSSLIDLSLPDKAGKLMANLAAAGFSAEAVELMKSLLALSWPSDSDKRDELGGRRWEEEGSKFDPWLYGQILQHNVPAVVAAAGLRALEALCKLLQCAIQASTHGLEKQADSQDYSYVWCDLVERAASDSADRLKNALVAAIRDAALQLAKRDLRDLSNIAETLEQHNWSIFRRIALYVVSQFPDAKSDLVAARLTDRAFFEDVALRPEYALLAESRFATLDAGDREKILGWIEQGPDVEKWRETRKQWFGQVPSLEEAEEHVDRWRLDRLRPLRDFLPKLWKERYDILAARHGEPHYPAVQFPVSSAWSGETSPKQLEDLQSMSVSEIVEFSRTWKQPEGWGAPSGEGLASILHAAVISQPERFVLDAKRISEAAPPYVVAVLGGFRDTVKNGVWQPAWWANALALCQFTADRPERRHSGTTEAEHDELLGSRSERQALLDLLATGFEDGAAQIPFTLREVVWQLLSHFTSDSEPTPEDDARIAAEGAHYVTGLITTIRGLAIQAVVQYALWTRCALEKASDGGSLVRDGFKRMPEVRVILERHLDPHEEPSPIIRSVYARWFPWLGLLDPSWAAQHADHVFPAAGDQGALHDVAWASYVVGCRPYDEVFRILKSQYAEAVKCIGPAPAPSRLDFDPSAALAEHLMVFLGRGVLAFPDHAGLIEQFFANAPLWLRAHALEFVGHVLKAPKGKGSPAVLSRFQELWTWRTKIIAASPEICDKHPELVAFGWWFVSEQFDDGWALSQLKNALQLSKWSEPANQVVECMAKAVPAHAADVLACLETLIENDVQRWHIHMWCDNAQHILSIAMRDDAPTTRLTARKIINWLGERGYLEFRKLLPTDAA